MSVNILEADGLKQIAGNVSSVPDIKIDSELSATSENPVQNKVVTGAITEIERNLQSLTPEGIGAVATSKVLTTKEQIMANTDVSNVAGATAIKEINSDLSKSESGNLAMTTGISDNSGGASTKYYVKNGWIEVSLNIMVNSGYVSGTPWMAYPKTYVVGAKNVPFLLNKNGTSEIIRGYLSNDGINLITNGATGIFLGSATAPLE